jgi:hypothetical protein
MLEFYPLLGVHVFASAAAPRPAGAAAEPSLQKPEIRLEGDVDVWTKARGIQASGRFHLEDRRLTVLKGSLAHSEPTPTCSESIVALHRSLVDDGILEFDDAHYVFTRDHTFGSPSTAAAIVTLRSSNGWEQWRLQDGRPLDAAR